MKHIYTYGGQYAQRHLTVGCILRNIAPRHARAFGNVGAIRAELRAERARALQGYRAAVMDGSFPDADTTVCMAEDELKKLREGLGKLRPVHR